MKKFLTIPLVFLSVTAMTAMTACSPDDISGTETEQPADSGQSGDGNTPEEPDVPGNPEGDNPEGSSGTKTLVAYFSAQGHTQAVAERIAELTGADIFRIEAADPYAENPYDDSDRIQNEAYNNLRPEVGNLPDDETIAAYDTLFVGSPCWWHQPAMVVCTFLEEYDLEGKVVIPFFTYGATTYLNESMQKIYSITPDSIHIPATLPEDLEPDDITVPGPSDDAGIDMPGNAGGTEAWLRRAGIIE